MTPNDATRIAVIGGGLSGLIAAVEASKAGRSVVLFEGMPTLGGRAGTLKVEGYLLNQGPHALYAGGVLGTWLAAHRIAVSGGGPDLAGGVAAWGAETSPLPFGRGARSPRPPLTDADEEDLATFFEQAVTPGLGRDRPLGEVLAPMSRRARAVAEALVRLTSYAASMDEIRADAALSQLRLSLSGATYLDGGWERLVKDLETAAMEAGVRIERGRRVTAVSRSGIGYAVKSKAGAEDFGVVILAVPPKSACAIAAFSGHLRACVSRVRRVRIMSLDLALSALQAPSMNFALGMDQPIYLSVHSTMSRLAPPGGIVAHVSRYLRSDETPDPDMFDDLERFADRFLPGWRDRIIYERRLTGAIVAHDLPRPGHKRPSAIVEDAPGLFLAGDWVGDVGLLADAGASSARQAAAAANAWLGEVATSGGTTRTVA